MARKNNQKRGGSFRDKMRDDIEKRKSGGGFSYLKKPNGVKMFIPDPDTKYLFDIVPYEVTDIHHPDRNVSKEKAVEGTLWYKRPYKTHRRVGVNKETLVCPRSFGKKCPICDYREQLYKEEAPEEELKATNASDRNLYAVVPIGDKKYEEEIHLFDFSDFLFQERLIEQLGDKDEIYTFADPEEGSSLSVRFAENTFGKNKFADPTRFDFEPRDYIYDEEFLDTVPNLDECFIVLDYSTIKAKFFEIAEDEPEEEEEEPEEEKPTRRKKSATSNSRRKKRVEEEPEEEEEEPEEEPEEEEEEERPKRQSRNRTSSKRREREKAKPKNECPHGYNFGEDNDAYDECENCKVWNECYDKYEEENEE